MSKKTDTNIPTPRTDALEKESSSDGFHAYAADGWKLARQLERELAQAKADLAAASKDSERLDWLNSQLEGCVRATRFSNGKVDLVAGNTVAHSYDTLRAAIDAAMEGGER